MALDLFKLLGTIEVDNSKANQALDETSDKGTQTQSKLSKAFGAVGKGVALAGKTIVTGLAAGGTAFSGLTAKALSASGELEQNMGGSEAVFKQYAGKLQDTAKTAFSNMGLSTSDYLATANKMGALFQGAGFDIEESMNLSSDAMQRAADVASIMGIDTGAAMEAIAGAAKGNFTMMDNLGVAMNDTTLQAYALEKGINKSTSEMTNQEKIGLAMEMFMDKTAYAAGNYAKENETLAGSLGTAKSALTNFLDGSGDVESLVSSFGNLANVAVKSLQEILPRLTTGLSDIVKQVMPLIPPLLNTLLPAVIDGATSLISGLVSAMPGIIGTLMDALPALIAGVVQITNAVVESLPQIFTTIISALPTLIPMLINGIVSMVVTLCQSIPMMIQPIVDYLPDIIISIVNALVQNLPILLQGITTMIVGLVRALPTLITGLVDAIPTIIELLVGVIVDNVPMLINCAIDIVMALVDALPQIIQSLIDALPVILKAVYNAITKVFKSLPEWFGALWNGIKNVAVSVWNALKTSVSSIVTGLGNVLKNIWNGIKNTVSNVWNGIKNTVSNVINGVKNTVSNVFNNIKNTVTNIWNNIKNAITGPVEKARDIVKGIIDKIKGFFSFKISWPKIPMPHFALKPSGWQIGDLLKGSIPKLGIDWYAKAMDNPIVMTKPTIWGYDPETGNLQGGGEAGSEVVSGTNTLMSMIRSAVSLQNEAVVKVLTAILNAIVGGNEEMLRALLAGHSLKIGEREFGRLVKEYA